MAQQRGKIVASIAVLFAIAAIVFWTQLAPPPAATPTAPPAESPAPSPAVASLPVANTEPARVEAPAAVQPEARDPQLAHVRGRCLDEGGTPLRGCTTKLRAFEADAARMAMQGKVDWKDPEPLVTGDDGRFDVAFAPPSGMQFTLDVAAPDRVPRTGRWGQLEPAQIVDLGDIVVARGFAVSGRVVDEQGAPVAKAGVMLRSLPLPIAPDMAANDTRYGFSDASGAFRITVPVPVGTWPLGAEARGMRLVSPDHVTVTERGIDSVLVVLRAMPSIAGIVVDEVGQPVEGVSVEAALHRSGRMASARSRKDGTFTIFAVDADPKPVALEVDNPGPCEPPPPDPRLWEWGSKDVRITLRRAQSAELRVVERGTGAPVVQYAVSCYGTSARSSLFTDLRLSGEHPDGRVTIDRVWRGKNVLTVVPLDRALLPSARIEFEVGDAGVPPLRVELERLTAAVVRVRTSAGAPVASSKVEVAIKGSEPFALDSWIPDREGRSGIGTFATGYREHQLIAVATTGVDGVAAVFVPTSPDDLIVRARGEHPAALVDPAVFSADRELTLTVPDSGAIGGIVVMNALDCSRLEVVIERRTEKGMGRGTRTKPAPDGSFAVRGLTPDTYELSLWWSVHYADRHGGSTSQIDLPVHVPAVEVTADRTAAVRIDASAIALAIVRGRVLLDGAPPASADVELVAGYARFGAYALTAEGTFEAPELPPGTYHADLIVGDRQAASGERIRADQTFELAAGQTLVRDFVFVRRKVVITVLHADGKPAANLVCMVHGDGVHMPDQTTDVNGRLVIDPAPTVPFHVQPRNQRVALGPVQIPTGASTHDVTLTLPAADVK